MYSFDIEIRVEYVDTDQMGIMHNSRYFLFFEKGRTETMRKLNIGYKTVENSGIMMPLCEQYAHYILPAFYDELLIVRTYIKEKPMARIRFDYEVIRKENNNETIICSGYNILAFVDIKTRKPLRCPAWIRENLADYTYK
ncbi:MAG: acyl-CoA thioesterase [Bacteroidales bacterium]|jgi:acyl-CoA thioester hydrolase|nr:acyl-CoA thioesterase [Bacteroidales bacterium]